MLKLGCRIFALGLACAVALFDPGLANAGCGCDKPPPPPAAVRPAFASPGATITLFGDRIRTGKVYKVRFRTRGEEEATVVNVTAVTRRDLADGAQGLQLRVVVPALPPGPARITVRPDIGETEADLEVEDTKFTILPETVTLEQINGETLVKCFRGAVGADRRVYIPLNIAAIAERIVFSGLGTTYPLMFQAGDVTIYNTQGFLMQLLGPNSGTYAISDPGGAQSFELTYDRHEFNTYRAQHVHEGTLALDAADPAWHVDGTRHIDHENLVIAIEGTVEGQGLPGAGKTPAFDLSIVTSVGDGSGPPTSRVIDRCSS